MTHRDFRKLNGPTFLRRDLPRQGRSLLFFNRLTAYSSLINSDHKSIFANAIDTQLMNIEAAKAHPDVIKKIKSEALNGVDAVIEKLLTESGYDETDIAEIKADKNLRVEIRTMDVHTHAEMTKDRWEFLVDGVRDLLNRIASEMGEVLRG